MEIQTIDDYFKNSSPDCDYMGTVYWNWKI